MKDLSDSSVFFKTIDQVVTPIIIEANTTETNTIYFNKAFKDEIGYNTNEITDRAKWWNAAYPEPAYRMEVVSVWSKMEVAAVNQEKQHINLVSKICCADKSLKWYDVHSVVVGQMKLITFLNINRAKEKNESLINTIQQKNLLLSILTHDIRSPLGNIKGLLDAYKMNCLNKAEIADVFSMLIGQIDYVLNMINTTRLRIGTETGVFRFCSAKININDFLDRCNQVFNYTRINQHINFVFEIPASDIIYYDRFILEIIFRNIIDNAIKHTPQNGTIKISLIHHAKYSSLMVTDSGKGMTRAQMEAITNNINQRDAGREIVDGFGLGLISAKEILERHRGKLAISSSPAGGTSCEIMIYN
ncbi:Histidine kinase-, DNA gyrase B-, and HSP90-like ATPase [Mucilaginibacter pineti]|uniref:histidine kinase n=1 Tax=Mucilaginibacter pineti TaxID=1391627 RepID=A0A1G7C616_9SPHI|nr:HAMP domain-containing sensor histidine kinase [Mucilaginibacter pineti]SDE34220.1 Histidine kinase-, DNA gyrase B-, and HSP90-like ATPase [Mucilaginibacter pineti]